MPGPASRAKLRQKIFVQTFFFSFFFPVFRVRNASQWLPELVMMAALDWQRAAHGEARRSDAPAPAPSSCNPRAPSDLFSGARPGSCHVQFSEHSSPGRVPSESSQCVPSRASASSSRASCHATAPFLFLLPVVHQAHPSTGRRRGKSLYLFFSLIIVMIITLP